MFMQSWMLMEHIISIIKKRERTDWKINILAGKRMFHVDVELSLVVMISFACKWNGFRQSVKLSWYYIISMMFELV